MILPKVRDPRLMTIRRGGILTDSEHQLLALWAAACAEHVLDLFESTRPEDPRPRSGDRARSRLGAWRGQDDPESKGWLARQWLRPVDLRGAARHAAYAAGRGRGSRSHVARARTRGGRLCTPSRPHVPPAPQGDGDGVASRLECRWQRDQLPEAIRELVLDDQRLRNDICWSVFEC